MSSETVFSEEQALDLLKIYHDDVIKINSSSWWEEGENLPSYQALLNTSPRQRIILMRVILENVGSIPYSNKYRFWRPMFFLYEERLPYTTEDIRVILHRMTQDEEVFRSLADLLLKELALPLADPETLVSCTSELKALQALCFRLGSYGSYYDEKKRDTLKLLADILYGPRTDSVPIQTDEWGKAPLAALAEMEEESVERWISVLQHCARANGSKPTKKWESQVQGLIEQVGRERFCKLATRWIASFSSKRNVYLDEENTDILKGLVWCCCQIEDAALAAVLGDAAIEGYRKVPGVGPRLAKVGSASVLALKCMPNVRGAAQLERVRLNVKQPTYVKGIEAALDEVAQQAGMSRADLEELTVPTFDLRQGEVRITIGSWVACLTVNGSEVNIQWFDAAGSPRKSESAELKRSYKAELKELKRLRDEIAHMLHAQRDRLERFYLHERNWSLPAWRERYLEHPLLGLLAKRLIWNYTDGAQRTAVIWHEDHFVASTGEVLEVADTATISLWHPALCEASEVSAWREWLETNEIRQPFKQAHREVYLLTDAERATGVYSNRFAAHILRQHQFNALAIARGWRSQLRLLIDAEYAPPDLVLPHWGLRAEFWIEEICREPDVDCNEVGVYLRVTTDQVRFYALHENPSIPNAPIPLEEIPVLAFSEVMRDVDLFVGVASIGNDPTWSDGGPQGHFLAYWHAYSFGDLSASAQTRQQQLVRLLPRLSIGERCTIDGRFLKVRGDLRTYKIHLGSGNILMEPNDQYLCIVPQPSRDPLEGGPVFLPFEGDTVFSIILSKAFLLAEDTKITDVTITRQIEG